MTDSQELDAKMEQYQGDFVESADLMNIPNVTLRIAGVVPPETEKDKAKKLIKRPIISFEKARKRMVIGKTNERILKALLGAKASSWIGKDVTIGVRYLAEAFGQKNVPTLRIIIPPGKPVPFSVQKHYGKETPWTN